MNYSMKIKEKLLSIIKDMERIHWLFTRNAEKDLAESKNGRLLM